MKYYLGIACMFRDESRWICEWVEYHRLLGVEHFYLYDHLSNDHPELVLAEYISKGIVTLERINSETGGNFMGLAIQTYNKAIKQARHECQWLALLDSDEYIVPKETTHLPKFLKEFEPYGGLVINWQMFGTNEIDEVPMDQTMIELLTRRGVRTLGHCQHIKSIIQPLHVKKTILHFAYYNEGFYAVNSHHERIDGPFDRSIPTDRIQLNHYFVRDRKFLVDVKIPRRVGLGLDAETLLRWERSMNMEEDDSIQRFVGPLKARMGLPLAFEWEAYARKYPSEQLTNRSDAYQHWQKVGKFQEEKERLLLNGLV